MPVHDFPLRPPFGATPPRPTRGRNTALPAPDSTAVRVSAALAVAGGLTAAMGLPASASDSPPDVQPRAAVASAEAGRQPAVVEVVDTGIQDDPGSVTAQQKVAATGADRGADGARDEADVDSAQGAHTPRGDVSGAAAGLGERVARGRTPGTEAGRDTAAQTASARPVAGSASAGSDESSGRSVAAQRSSASVASVVSATAPVTAVAPDADASQLGPDEAAIAQAVRVAWEQARESGRPVVVVLPPLTSTPAGSPSADSRVSDDETPATGDATAPVERADQTSPPLWPAAGPDHSPAPSEPAASATTPAATREQAVPAPVGDASTDLTRAKPVRPVTPSESAAAPTSTPTTKTSTPTSATERTQVAKPAPTVTPSTRHTRTHVEKKAPRSARPRVNTPTSKPAVNRAVAVAAGLSGIDYVWGGTSTRGFDCSGYTQHVYRKLGVSLPRTAAQQQRFAKRVSAPRPGDLVFFGARAHHVGIYAGKGKMYDAPRTGKQTGLHRIWSRNVTYGRVA